MYKVKEGERKTHTQKSTQTRSTKNDLYRKNILKNKKKYKYLTNESR